MMRPPVVHKVDLSLPDDLPTSRDAGLSPSHHRRRPIIRTGSSMGTSVGNNHQGISSLSSTPKDRIAHGSEAINRSYGATIRRQ